MVDGDEMMDINQIRKTKTGKTIRKIMKIKWWFDQIVRNNKMETKVTR